MQNQSNTNTTNLEKINDFHEFNENHVSPYGTLWSHTPHSDLSWMHVHNYLEIGRCVKGSGTFCVDGKVYKVKSPCVAIMYEGCYHSAQSNPHDESEWNFLYIDLKYYLSMMDSSFVRSLKCLDHTHYDFPYIMYGDEYKFISGIVDAIFEECSSVNAYSDQIISGLLLSLLTAHSRIMKKSDNKFTDDSQIHKIAPAISLITSKYSEKLTIDMLASSCYISPSSLRRYFVDSTGMSPQEYIHNVRIKNAAVMLTTTKKTILEISIDTGYPTLSSFNRQFSAHYKMSPHAYRKKYTD